MSRYRGEAVSKLNEERKAAKKLSKKAAVVLRPVTEALQKFSEQDDEFAQAIAQTDKTVRECCEYVVKGAGNSLSDIEAFRRAAEFYFPGANIAFEMRIELCASDDSISKKPTIIDITELL